MTQETNRVKRLFEKKEGRKRLLIILLVVIACIAAAIACGLKGRTPESGQKGNSVSSADTTNCEVETPVGKLVFPEDWAEFVQVEDTSSAEQFSASFYGTAGDDKVLLFEISVGPNGSGYQLGSAPDTEGKRQHIWLNIREIESKSSWSNEEVTRINTMQECVNDLIEQLHEIDGFRENE